MSEHTSKGGPRLLTPSNSRTAAARPRGKKDAMGLLTAFGKLAWFIFVMPLAMWADMWGEAAQGNAFALVAALIWTFYVFGWYSIFIGGPLYLCSVAFARK